MQVLDNTVKKLDLPINDQHPMSIHSNTTIYFLAQSSDRHGRNSSIIDYQLNINMLSKFIRMTSFSDMKGMHTHFNKYLLSLDTEERKKKKEPAEGRLRFVGSIKYYIR